MTGVPPPELRSQIRSFILGYTGQPELADDRDIFTSRLVNSLFAMQLVLFVENQLGVTVADADLDLDNFNSVEAITSFVERKRRGDAGR
jgi:acyl carrier protein